MPRVNKFPTSDTLQYYNLEQKNTIELCLCWKSLDSSMKRKRVFKLAKHVVKRRHRHFNMKNSKNREIPEHVRDCSVY